MSPEVSKHEPHLPFHIKRESHRKLIMGRNNSLLSDCSSFTPSKDLCQPTVSYLSRIYLGIAPEREKERERERTLIV